MGLRVAFVAFTFGSKLPLLFKWLAWEAAGYVVLLCLFAGIAYWLFDTPSEW
jgi:hypothetical protein